MMIKRIFIALLTTVAIPIIGYLIASWILGDINSKVAGKISVELLCQITDIASKFKSTCETIQHIVLLKDASLWSGIVAVGLIVSYIILSLVAGRNRKLNAIIFPFLIPFSTLIIAGLVLVEGAILTYAAYIGESHAIGRVHYVLIGGIGLGAAIVAFKLIGALTSIKASIEQIAVAKQLDNESAPKLWILIDEIAKNLGSEKPDNVIVGLEPTFYATAAKTKLINDDKALNGTTLFLSLPLMRLFNIDELKAVIGHELGHFKGQDTNYTLKFAPVYAGLSKSISSLDEGEDGATLASLPAISMLSLMLELFSRNERHISRDREFTADNAGISISSVESLATSLGKVAIYSHLWESVRQGNVERLNNGKITANLSSVFEDSAKYDISHRTLDDILENILKTRISHPTDTHPTISERYKNIKFPEKNLTTATLIKVGNSGQGLINEMDEIEKELTLFEHQLMVAFGAVEIPETETDNDENKTNDSFLNAIYSLGAAMVGADGKIDQAEIQTAEILGNKLIEGFDSVDFRQFCQNLDELPSFNNIVEILGTTLTDSGKISIYDYLKEIAYADNELADEEKELLLFVRDNWGLEV
jgi:Zn-dependent protease with chaperone function